MKNLKPGTSSNSTQCTNTTSSQEPAASSQDPAALDNSGIEDTEKSDEYSAQSQDSERTSFYSDLYVLTDDEHWTMTPETQKYAAAARLLLLRDHRKWRTTGCLQFDTMPWCLDDVTNNSGSKQVEIPQGVDRREICWNAV